MDKLFIVAEQPQITDHVATERWRDVLRELQDQQETGRSGLWIANNIALLSATKDADLAKRIATALLTKGVKHSIYMAIECNQQMYDFYHRAL